VIVAENSYVIMPGIMGVFEKVRGSGVWSISYCDRLGQRHRERVGRRAEAENAYTERKREIREGRFLAPRSRGFGLLTFDKLANAAMEHKKLRMRPLSYSGEAARLEIIRPMLGHMEAISIKPAHVESVLSKLIKERQLGGSAANRYRSFLSTIFSYGMRMGMLYTNPVGLVRSFKENDYRVRWLTPEEEATLRAVIVRDCPQREPEFDLSLYTGMRRGEQFSLKWEKVDLERGLLDVYGKSGQRFVQVNSSAKAALLKLKETRLEGAIYVCPDKTSEDKKDSTRWFENAVKKAGIKNFRRHDLRHSFASRLVMAGVHLLAVKELLGHHSITMTEKYSHLSPGVRQVAVEKIGRLPLGTSDCEVPEPAAR
jgi:site-specific recombinase XerD